MSLSKERWFVTSWEIERHTGIHVSGRGCVPFTWMAPTSFECLRWYRQSTVIQLAVSMGAKRQLTPIYTCDCTGVSMFQCFNVSLLFSFSSSLFNKWHFDFPHLCLKDNIFLVRARTCAFIVSVACDNNNNNNAKLQSICSLAMQTDPFVTRIIWSK